MGVCSVRPPMNNLKIPDLLGLGSAGSLILTIVYLHGYSITLGVSLFLYFGLNDYFRLAIELLPPLIGAGIVGVLVTRFFTRVERGATEPEIAAQSRNPKFTRRFRQFGDAAMPIALVAAAVFNTALSFFRPVPSERLYGLWGVAGGVLWFALVAWYVKEPKVVQKWTASWYLFVTLFPALAILAFCYGLYAGKTGTQLYTRPSDVQISLRGETTPMAGRILFLLNDYVVLRGQQAVGVIAVPRAEVTRIVHSTGL